MAKCNKDCFNCPYEDCVLSEEEMPTRGDAYHRWLQKKRERYHSDPEYRAKQQAAQKRWYEANKAKIAERTKEYRDANREEIYARAKKSCHGFRLDDADIEKLLSAKAIIEQIYNHHCESRNKHKAVVKKIGSLIAKMDSIMSTEEAEDG